MYFKKPFLLSLFILFISCSTTNIEDNGAIINDNGDVDGYVEETFKIEERFQQEVDRTQDEEKKEADKEKENEPEQTRKVSPGIKIQSQDFKVGSRNCIGITKKMIEKL